ncbi:MAG: phosphoribosylglycinamide formyltransferase [Opitutae bacterium]|jgi:phosphoribosylglycinamide formyltransferase 1|nr:phosphoribosylglycinamide formyltransferase [Opitutae bacterium]MBT4225667.1 phosphoribosylglycinamide formyltransferase [Opitutae bacterium]MBT5378257.1 phosphoribosylglycinamide formyltransferase [Opitutae bacterium]MBT5690333.1 phosphoribosylglycinamide formyltransferase [Opitutae bacterium]MBT6462490.1 phosphoribosylglycinamide formyltransferase [Opitutae bacterium]
MRFIILGSGSGTNAKAILEAQKAGLLGDAQATALGTDREGVQFLDHAAIMGIPGEYLHPGLFRTKLEGEAEQSWIDRIRLWEPDLIVLAGLLRVLKPPFINAFSGRIINLHPSLLPSFSGLHSIRQSFEHGAKYSGCTVHWVTPTVDAGPIIDQTAVRIEPNDTLDSLELKVHAAEHKLLPDVIRRLSLGQIAFPEKN